MSLLCFCVFLSLPGVRQQIAGPVVGDRKAGREKGGRKSFCKLGKGHRQNALNLSCTIGSLALREKRGGEKFAFACVRSVLYLIPPHVEPWESAFVLKSSCVYCTFCLPFLFCFGSTPLFWNSFFHRSSPCGRAARREAGLVISKAARRTLLHYCNLKM